MQIKHPLAGVKSLHLTGAHTCLIVTWTSGLVWAHHATLFVVVFVEASLAIWTSEFWLKEKKIHFFPALIKESLKLRQNRLNF